MCWNKDVSLNTFLFSFFVLLLIIYNNLYTKYKIDSINSFWAYMFLFSFIIMQLIEYFIWKNVNNPFYNKIFTLCAIVIILVQPVVSLMNVSNKLIRNNMIFIYLTLLAMYCVFAYWNYDIYSIITNKGHLNWRLNNFNKYINSLCLLVWLFFFLFRFFYERNMFAVIFGLSTLLVTIYNLLNDKSITSMWCWIANTVMFYYAGYLLFYLPLYK